MAPQKKVILVTGGSGLVGSGIRLAHDADPNEDETYIFAGSKDANLFKLDETQALFAKYKPTHVIHLAAWVGGLYLHLKSNSEMLRKNLHINDNVLHTSRETNVQKVVSCLSVCIFPDGIEGLIDETMIHAGPPHSSNFGYAYAKRLLDFQNQAFFSQYGIKYNSAVLTNVFGPYDNFHLEHSHVIPGLIHKTYLAKRDNQPLVVPGTGKALRQFIFSIDLGRLFIWSVRYYDEVDPIIFAVDASEEISIAEVVKMVVNAFDFKGEVIFDSSKSDGQYKRTASNSKLRKYLPDFKFTPIEEAIQQTVDWFTENFETARK